LVAGTVLTRHAFFRRLFRAGEIRAAFGGAAVAGFAAPFLARTFVLFFSVLVPISFVCEWSAIFFPAFWVAFSSAFF
jgi:hypothetical protein